MFEARDTKRTVEDRRGPGKRLEEVEDESEDDLVWRLQRYSTRSLKRPFTEGLEWLRAKLAFSRQDVESGISKRRK